MSLKKLALAGSCFFAVAVGAFAFWSSTGAGTGSGGTGTTEAVVVTQTSTITGLYPGSPATALTGKFNNANPGPVRIGSVTVALGSITGSSGTPACTIADYQINDATATVNAEIPTGTGVGAWSGPSIQMLNTSTNQDACKNATVNLTYTSN